MTPRAIFIYEANKGLGLEAAAGALDSLIIWTQRPLALLLTTNKDTAM